LQFRDLHPDFTQRIRYFFLEFLLGLQDLQFRFTDPVFVAGDIGNSLSQPALEREDFALHRFQPVYRIIATLGEARDFFVLFLDALDLTLG